MVVDGSTTRSSPKRWVIGAAALVVLAIVGVVAVKTVGDRTEDDRTNERIASGASDELPSYLTDLIGKAYDCREQKDIDRGAFSSVYRIQIDRGGTLEFFDSYNLQPFESQAKGTWTYNASTKKIEVALQENETYQFSDDPAVTEARFDIAFSRGRAEIELVSPTDDYAFSEAFNVSRDGLAYVLTQLGTELPGGDDASLRCEEAQFAGTLEDPVGQARVTQSNLRNAITSAKAIFTDSEDYRDATPAALAASEPSLTFVTGDQASTSRSEISVSTPSANEVVVSARAESGKCFAMRDVLSDGVSYAVWSGPCAASQIPHTAFSRPHPEWDTG